VAEYVSQLLGRAMEKNRHLYLRTMSVVLNATRNVVRKLTNQELPKHLDISRGINLLFKLFLPFLDDYLFEESHYVEQSTKDQIDDWVR
jgi:recyclin-1